MKRHRLGLFVMIDALGHRFLRDHDFLPELDYRAGLRTVLGFSCSCQPTLLTGKLPREHGHGAMYMLRDQSSVLDAARPFAWLPSFVADNHRIRSRIYGRVAREIEGYFSLYECPTRLLPRFDLVEQRSIFRPRGIRNAKSIFDRLVELKLSHRTYTWDTPEDQNFASVEADIRGGAVDFVFLYLPRMDSLLHSHGNGSSEVLAHLSWYELQLRRLFEIADAHADVVEAFVFSDHGMSDVHGSFDLVSAVERKLGRNGDRYLAFYDSTMARFWVEDDAVRATLMGLLEDRTEGRVVPREELASLGVDFPDRSQGDVIFVASEGLLILPSYMGKSMLAGMHGYHPDAQYADACLLGAHTPDLSMSHLVDLFALMDDVAVRLAEEKS